MASFPGGGLRGLALPARARVLDYGGNVPVPMGDAAVPPPLQPRQPSPFQPGQRDRSLSTRATAGSKPRPKPRDPRWVPRHASGKVWFPALESPAARTKFFHACVSGTLLAITLIVCT